MSPARQSATHRLTVGQAVVRFLAAQRCERDGHTHRLIPRILGIFGHGNVAGIGQALAQDPQVLPYHLVRNEQAAVHAAAAYAKVRHRMQTLAVTTSIGPGATNLVTGAALATINRLPVLLLPGDSFATRAPDPVLQQLEDPRSPEVSVNDTLRPVSRFWTRVQRPEQLPAALIGAMRVLTDPVATGAVTICLPQDVQAEAFDWPAALFEERVWRVPRPAPDPAAIVRAAEAIRFARRPLVVAGGAVRYADASAALRRFASETGIPVADTHAGKGAIQHDHPCAVGGLGVTGTAAANELARTADLVVGVGTRFTDFTTASRSIFAAPGVRFIGLNIDPADAVKFGDKPVVADARAGLDALTAALHGWRVPSSYTVEVNRRRAEWTAAAAPCQQPGDTLGQVEIFAALNELLEPRDIVVNAAGSMPGDLQALWRASDPDQYHVEYGYSCMGYEIPGAMGAQWATHDAQERRRVVAIVGDGSYQMMPAELATIVSERLPVIVVLLDNHGFASIAALSESVGSEQLGTWYRMRDASTGRLDGPAVPVDLAANAASWGIRVLRCEDLDSFRSNLRQVLAGTEPVVLYAAVDPSRPGPPRTAWWDVPVAQTSATSATHDAHTAYERSKEQQRPLQ